MTHRSAILLSAALAVIGCGKPEIPETPVARVDGQTLTMEHIRTRFDSARGVSDAQVHTYIQQWITDEMLYREAVRRGLDQQPSVTAQMEDVRRRLVINALMEKEIYNTQSAESTPDEIAAYYEEHKAEFILTADIVLVSFALFAERDAANQFRSTVLRGTPWGTATRDLEQGVAILARVDSTYFTQQTLYPPELWRAATGIGAGSPSFPLRTDDGYYVLIVWRYARQGQQAELAYVEPEIRSRLAIQRRQALFSSFLENLRAQHAVELLIAPDMTGQEIEQE
ncbi:MAG TPA: peptidylprolyl isomerase [Bacteroidota bacterium]